MMKYKIGHFGNGLLFFGIRIFSIECVKYNCEMENRKSQSLENIMPESVIHKRKPRAVSSFLKKTYEILEEVDNHYAVKWAYDGIGFIVAKEEEFSKQILPKYFKHSNYSSFVRQLNMYNFHKIRQANNESHFHHENFQRNNKALLSEIKRKPEKKKRKNDESEDDLKSEISVKERIKQNKQNEIFEDEEVKMKSWKECQNKRGVENTHHVFVSEKEQLQNSKERISIQNILLLEKDDDKISINNELDERFPRYPTREIFCPSNNNIYPFPFREPLSHFHLFF